MNKGQNNLQVKDASPIMQKDIFPIGQETRGVTYFLCLKVEKIVAAIYLITEDMEPEDSLRERLRSESIGFLSDINGSCAHSTPLVLGSRLRLLASIDLLLSLFQVASLAHMVAGEGSKIVMYELEKGREMLLKNADMPGLYETVLGEGFFETPLISSVNSSRMNLVASSDLVYKRNDAQIDRGTPILRVEGMDKKRMAEVALPRKSQLVTSVEPKGSKRRDEILSSLEKNKEYSIKDIVHSAPGVSEKTVQRELAALVLEGRIERQGERRWSRYRRLL